MNRTALSLTFAMILAGSAAFAQQAAPVAHAPNPEKQAQRMSRALNLNADQSAKLEPILADRDQKIAELRASTTLTPKQLRQQMRTIRENTQQQLSTVLTADQMKEFREMQQRHHQQEPQPATQQPAA